MKTRTLGPNGPTVSTIGLGCMSMSAGYTRPESRAEALATLDDRRRSYPRFQGKNFAANLALVDTVKALAVRKGITASQLALAWVLAKGPHVVPIPGTQRRRYLEENVGAIDVVLGAADLAEVDAAFPPDSFIGDRYPADMMRSTNG